MAESSRSTVQDAVVTVALSLLNSQKLGETMSSTCTTSPVDSSLAGVTPSVALHGHERPTHKRKGKAPPVDSFSGEDEAVRLDDWMLTLKRAATWNDWSEGDLLLQLAGHLHGHALQEWDLIPKDIKSTFRIAVDALRDRLDPGGRMLAVQDFRHAAQKSEESVADFIRRLERCFRVAYGRHNLGKEAQEALLHGQFQEGLRMELMKSPSVSGAQSYPTLCLAAKNEERRLAQLKKRQRYKDTSGMQQTATQASQLKFNPRRQPLADERKSTSSSSGQTQIKCYTCGSTKHLQRDCTMSSTESKGGNQKPSQTRQVIVSSCDDPRTYLHSESDPDSDDDVRRVTVEDMGSHPKYAEVLVEGVSLQGVVDTGSALTLMGKEAFKKVAMVAKLRKKDFRPADKKAYNYDGKPFTLDGRLQLNLTFGEYTMSTPVYVKMDAEDQLLLSEGVCRQLGIVSYHPNVCEHQKQKVTTPPAADQETT